MYSATKTSNLSEFRWFYANWGKVLRFYFEVPCSMNFKYVTTKLNCHKGSCISRNYSASKNGK